ncbi:MULTISPECIES: response regulator [Methylocaldum]|jgi:DNA-binding NarL/FixJ family response regulator|uniref:response regulator n=1 Tax=unclassified Methylocaldum TaxID=2622260 RepID=UPI00098A7FC9|nr:MULTISPECIES: response regulator transcription factor [unclassified Methylocaldum]MBP1150872.1 DNA-binding NarL/FixJ family response regulator [Methylocaldum sp. RMAD-M]MVF21020.1 response regulator transcription factor [Methylocaldum sp. BRCS4]
MIKILVADDHPIIRHGITHILSSTVNFSVVDEAADASEVLDKCRCTDIDVLVLDLSMPGTQGVDLIRRVQQIRPSLPILILTMHTSEQIAAEAIKAGAAGYITKDCEPGILVAGIRRVASGQRFIESSLAEKIVFTMVPDQFPHAALSQRERQILRLFASGKRVQDIADALSLSEKTVSTHKTRLMRKLSVKNNADLIRYAVEHDLI